MTSPADLDADRILPWVLRVLWLALPFTLGTQIGNALEGTSRPVQLTGTVGACDGAFSLDFNAFLAAEDGNFFGHRGVDYRSVVRAFAQNVAASGTDQLSYWAASTR